MITIRALIQMALEVASSKMLGNIVGIEVSDAIRVFFFLG